MRGGVVVLFWLLVISLASGLGVVARASSGSSSWFTLINGVGYEGVVDLVDLPGPTMFVAGVNTPDGSSYDAFVGVVTDGGSVSWLKKVDFGGDEGWARLYSPGGSVLYLLVSDTVNGGSYLVKLDAYGRLYWAKEITLGSGFPVILYDITGTGSGNLILAGEYVNVSSSPVKTGIIVVVLDSNGGVVGSLLLSGAVNLTATRVAVDGDGYIYVAGHTNAHITTLAGDPATYKDVLLVRVAPDLSTWTAWTLNYTIADYAMGLAYYDGRLYLAAEVRQDTYGNDIVLAAFNPATMAPVFEVRVNYNYIDEAFNLVVSSGGTLVVAGGTAGTTYYSDPNAYDALILELDANGTLVDAYNISSPYHDMALYADTGSLLAAGATVDATLAENTGAFITRIYTAPQTFTVNGTTYKVTQVTGDVSLTPETATINTAGLDAHPDTVTTTDTTPTLTGWYPPWYTLHLTTRIVGGTLAEPNNGGWPGAPLLAVALATVALLARIYRARP